MSGKVADIYAEVGFKFDQVKLKEVAKYIGDLNLASIISVGSLVALGEGIKQLIQETSALAVSLATIHSSTGVSTDFLQKFENASTELLASKESADAFIVSLSKVKAGLLLPGGTIPYGLRLMGFTKEDFQGTLEDNAKMVWTRLSQSKPPSNATQAMKEQWQGLLNNVASSFGVSPEQFMAMSNGNFGNKFQSAPFLKASELNESLDALTNWKTAFIKLNVELERLSILFLPIINALSFGVGKSADIVGGYNAFIKPGGIGDSAFANFINGIGRIPAKHISSPEHMIKSDNFWKSFWSGQSNYKKPQNVTINVAPMTIQAVDTKDFMNKFDDALTKYLKSTSLQFAQGQT